MEARPDAISIHKRLRGWPEKIRVAASISNIVLSKEKDVLCQLSNIVAADPEVVLMGYNMAGLDTLVIQDADLRCDATSLFDVASQRMDLYRSPIVKALRNCFPKGAGRCQTNLQSLRHIIELASPDYFEDVVGNWHDAACDAHVLRYNTNYIRDLVMLVGVSCK